MPNPIAIKIENLSKQYRLGNVGSGTLRDDFSRFWAKIQGKEDPSLQISETNDRSKIGESNFVWSLKEINLDIKKGDVVGIIGKNGAGKSTLLKILSKVTAPTIGNVKINGKIASLLEVGTGFHPELTGRENIFLNGAILGMRKSEINQKLDEIIAFSGVERYIDTPVKRYSSGMYVRLAFAVAAHLDSDVLIIDEVLAVGDMDFQKKCIGKMKDVSTNEGRTVLFVSHNMDAIARLCNKCIYLVNGQVAGIGSTDSIIQQYIGSETSISSRIDFGKSGKVPGNSNVRLLEAQVITEEFENKLNFQIDEKIGMNLTFEVLEKTDDLVCGFNLYNQQDVHILSSHDTLNADREYTPGVYQTTVWLPANFLSEGIHYCGIAMMSYRPFKVHFHDIGNIGFNVSDKQTGETVRGEYTGVFPGVIRPMLTWGKIEINNNN
jgi:lipopolysaccharide transport system ATP-binding protein